MIINIGSTVNNASIYGPDSPFPVDTVIVPEPGEVTGSRYRFGLSSADTAAMLRKLADDIESKAVSIQSTAKSYEHSIEDFELTRLTVVYGEPR
jgi:hypothetical protein